MTDQDVQQALDEFRDTFSNLTDAVRRSNLSSFTKERFRSYFVGNVEPMINEDHMWMSKPMFELKELEDQYNYEEEEEH